MRTKLQRAKINYTRVSRGSGDIFDLLINKSYGNSAGHF